MDPGGCQATSGVAKQIDLSLTTSSPLWTPGKRTDYTNTQRVCTHKSCGNYCRTHDFSISKSLAMAVTG